MQMSKAILVTLSGLAVLMLVPTTLMAKGLDKLSENNPENTAVPAEDAATKPADDAATGDVAAVPTTPLEKSDTSKAITDKLSISTSFGWASVSRSEGTWEGSGMSDVAIGYKVVMLGSNMNIDATYRYAPVAVSGDVDRHSYRGVWDTHYVGGRFNYNISPTLTALGTAELGYVLVYLHPTDGLETVTKHEDNGVAFAIGGGADWQILEKGLAVGPRLALAFGSVSTVQVAGAVTFGF